MKILKYIGIAIVAVLAVYGAYKLVFPSARFGDNSTLSGGLTILLSNIGDTLSLGSGANPMVSLNEKVSIGNCNSGSYAASSTLFAVSNPFSATSTAQLQVIRGTGQATSTNLQVGTSTVTTGITSSLISPTLINATVGTGTPQFTFNSGVLVGSIGFVTPGASTLTQIQVGPSDYVTGYATSTYGNAGALNYTPGLTCTYKIDWLN